MLILAIIALFFIWFDSVQQRKRKPVTRTVYAPAPLSQKEVDRIEREKAKTEKAEQERQQALAELDNLETLRQKYIDLYDATERQITAYTTETQRLRLSRQLISIEEKLIRLDAQKAKAYNKAHAA